MKLRIATTCLVMGTLLAPVAYAAGAGSDSAQAMTYVKDSAITAKVKAKLAADKMSSLTNITVNTDKDGKVYLSGNAKTQAQADEAASIARSTEGVTSVKSDIQIKRDD